jgi:hypothetical protein
MSFVENKDNGITSVASATAVGDATEGEAAAACGRTAVRLARGNRKARLVTALS